MTSGRQNVVFALFSIVALFYNCVERFPSLNVCSGVQRSSSAPVTLLGSQGWVQGEG